MRSLVAVMMNIQKPKSVLSEGNQNEFIAGVTVHTDAMANTSAAAAAAAI